MNLATIVRFLFGQRRAIFEIATTRSAIWLGLLFVISAGFAREYDGEDLLYEPWHLLIPLVASTATSILLFSVFWVCLSTKESEPDAERSFFKSYRSFLGIYWMTAPLAWLYAIPVEQFLSAGGATEANLWLLGVVALWRVFLMIRVGSVMFGASHRSSIGLVMLFAVSVAFTLVRLSPLPVVSVMGGIRLTESEEIIQVTSFLVMAFCVLSFPLWFVWAIVVLCRKRPAWRLALAEELERKVSPTAWVVGVLSLAIWVIVLPSFQREQQLRRQVERNLVNGRIEEALKTMSSHERSDFPAHWDPPPRPGYGERLPHLLDVVEVCVENDRGDWVEDVYLAKLRQSGIFIPWLPLEYEADRLDQLLDVLEKRPELIETFKGRLEQGPLFQDDDMRTPEQQSRINALLGIVEDASNDEGRTEPIEP